MKTEQQLDAMLSQLAPALEPQRDLWPDIAARLEPRRQPQHKYWLSAAAAAALIFWLFPQPLPTEPAIAVQAPAPVEIPGDTLLAVSAQLNQQLGAEQARQLRAVQQIPAGFDDWAQQIAIWNKAQSQIELALQFQPDDQKLIQKLQKIQQQQLSYIAKLVQTSELT